MVGAGAFERPDAQLAVLGVARQEDVAGGVIARDRQVETADCAEERVGDLDEDAGPVAVERIRAGGAAVVEVLEDEHAARDRLMRLLALDVGDEADAARVVLIGRVVQALGGGESIGGELVGHGRLRAVRSRGVQTV